MAHYKILNQHSFSSRNYTLVPIRMEDRLEIMKWRNEQIYHLRQAEPLTESQQNWYFDQVVAMLFDSEKPSQLLFSFLMDNKCIGYGGLVHINWIDKHAEISFIMETDLEEDNFDAIWSAYLPLIEEVAFRNLDFHKLFVYAFDLRPHLYRVLEKNDYFLDARLKDHCLFQDEFKDVVIYSKLKIK